ncbi:hypothetical protein ACH4YO_37160 [Streptomyces noursei]|uniref:hypothetical protein n=1 Tax=Streptomyces noursei TaxID=1971 RepID=UPI00081CB581|nr:membrane protein [Streptomyces noursei ATCC 11455]MCZ0993965.1 hypothetical protein [Streptomyces noursei]
MGEYASSDAAAALARAQELSSMVRKRTAWYVRYQVVYGCAAGLLVLVIGLVKAPFGPAIGSGGWVATIAALSVYAARQPVARRGFGRWHGILIGTWALLYSAVLWLGLVFFRGDASWWVPGAVVVSLPGLIGGYLEARK